MKLLNWLNTRGMLFLVLHFAGSIHAQTILPGEYQTGGYGQLTIGSADATGYQKFGISSMGANGHICDLGGKVRNNLAQLEYDPKQPEDRCDIRLTMAKRDVVEVKMVEEYAGGCRNYCGMRAGFEGSYAIPPEGCSSAQIEAATKRFSRQYKSRNYTAAAQSLESIYPLCKSWVFFTQEIDIRNDLAVTYSHLQRKDACIGILKPFTKAGISRKPDPDDEEEMNSEVVFAIAYNQPAYTDWARKAVNAARTNLKLCGYKFPAVKP
jgi:hypothetical protein